MFSPNDKLKESKSAVLALLCVTAPFALASCLVGCSRSQPVEQASASRVEQPAKQDAGTQKVITPQENAKATTPQPGKEASPPVPLKTKTIVYGQSVKKRKLEAFLLGEDSKSAKNTTIIFGAFHGNEPATPGVVRRLHQHLLAHPEILKGRRVILAPVVNPDGLAKGTRVNANKVDLNRNFPYGWKPTSRGPQYYPGKKAGSEPETQAVIRLMNDYKAQKIVSIHQPYHMMNYTGEPGRRLALAMKKHNGYRIDPDIGYPTPGSFGDYCGKQHKIAIVTLELPTQSAEAAWQANREALLAAIQMP